MTEEWVVAEDFQRILDESFDAVHAGFMRKFLGYVKDEHVIDDLKRFISSDCDDDGMIDFIMIHNASNAFIGGIPADFNALDEMKRDEWNNNGIMDDHAEYMRSFYHLSFHPNPYHAIFADTPEQYQNISTACHESNAINDYIMKQAVENPVIITGRAETEISHVISLHIIRKRNKAIISHDDLKRLKSCMGSKPLNMGYDAGLTDYGYMKAYDNMIPLLNMLIPDLKREPEWFGTHDLTQVSIDLIDMLNDSDGMPQEYIEQRLKSIAFDINDNNYPLI